MEKCNRHRYRVFNLFFLLFLSSAPNAILAQSRDELKDLFQLGSVHYSRGQFRFAAERFKRILTIGTDSELLSASRFYLAESLVPLEEYSEASQHLNRFLTDAPDHVFADQARYRLGEISYLSGDHETAFYYLSRFVKKHPEHPLLAFALPYLGELHLKKGNLDEALQAFQQALVKFPNAKLSDESRFGLARTLEKRGDDSEAVRFYRMLTESPESGRIADCLLQLAKMSFRGGDLTAADKHLDTILTNHANHELRHPVLYWKARVAIEKQDYTTANQVLKTALAENPLKRIQPALHYELGRSLSRQNRIVDSTQHLDTIIDQFATSDWGDDALLLKTQMVRNTQQFSLAIKLCRNFRSRYSESPILIHILELESESLFANRQFEAANDLYQYLLDNQHCIPLNESIVSTKQLENWKYRQALCWIEQDNHRLALNALESIDLKQIEEETENSIQLAKATCQIHLKRFTAASQNLKAYILSPSAAPEQKQKSIIDLALLLAKRGDFQNCGEWADKIEDPIQRHQTMLTIAELAFQSKQYHFASSWFGRVASEGARSQDRTEAMIGYVWAQKELGNIESALIGVDRLVQSFPESREAGDGLFLKAVLLEKAEKRSPSANAYLMLAKNFPRHPKRTQALLALCTLYRQSSPSKLPSLIPFLKSQIAAGGNSSLVSDTATLIYETAWIYHDQHQLDLAAKAFTEIYLKHSTSDHWPESTYRLARYRWEASDGSGALSLLDEIIDNTPNHQLLPQVLFEKGKIAFEENDYATAANAMQKVSNRFPQHDLFQKAAYWAAEANYRNGSIDLAIQQFNKLSTYAKIDNHPFHDSIHLRLAQNAISRSEWESAIDHAQHVLSRDVSTRKFEANYILGRAFAGKGKFDQARTAYQRVLSDELSENSETAAMAQWMIGETFFHQEDYLPAIDAYQRTEILHSFPTWQAAALLQCGKCFEELKRITEAVESYTRLVSEHKSSTFVTEANERLRSLKRTASANPASKKLK